MDGVKIMAEGIRVDKKILKTGAQGKRQSRRSATHDATNVSKDDQSLIINATGDANDKSAEPEDEEEVRTGEQKNKESEEDK